MKYFLGIIFFMSASLVFAGEDLCAQNNCIVVVDAGSSGTRAHLYSFESDVVDKKQNIRELYTKKLTPGFATLEPTREAISSYLDHLLKDMPTHQVPVYFYATAGMRLISDEQQQKLYGLLKQWFSSDSQWQLKDARTILGSEEGVYGWLSMNYSLNAFESNHQPKNGFIEVGGASIQLVFPIDDMVSISSDDVFRVHAFGRDLLLYAHSFLGAGVNEVSQTVLNTKTCFPNQYVLSDGELAQGDGFQCAQEIADKMSIDQETIANTQSALRQNYPDDWYAVGAPTYIIKRSTTDFPENAFSSLALLNFVNTNYCQKDWAVLKMTYPNDAYIAQYCLSGSLFYRLAVDDFGIPMNQRFHVLAENQNSDWTLGVVIQKISN